MSPRRALTALVAAVAVTLVPEAAASAGTAPPLTVATSATTPAPDLRSTAGLAAPDDLADGTALPPSRGPAGVQADRGRVAAASTPAVPLPPYRTTGVHLRTLPLGSRPYDNGPLVRGIVDSSGVRMFRLEGDPTLYNHPVGQASLSMAYLDYYRRFGNSSYLTMAERNAQRLVDRRVESRGGWYYPYDFDFAVHGDTTQTLRAPWYSGMAQGMALSAFTRLFELTGKPEWKAAADATYASLDTGVVPGEPFGTWVSSTGDLWLEEYPRTPAANSERVLNGHIFAAFGLYDYYLVTKDPAVLRLYDGALATVRRYVLSEFRQPGWASLYSLRHRMPTVSYHSKHVDQFLSLQHQTGEPVWTSYATTYRGDFPVRTSSGFAILTPSSTVAYKLDSQRRVIASRRVSIVRATGANADRRERSKGGPIMLRISNGGYAGWWFPESYAKARIRGAVDAHRYDPALRGSFASGRSFLGYRYDSRNVLVGTRRASFSTVTTFPITASAIVDGRLAYLVGGGPLAGYWVAADPGLRVR